MEEFVFQQVRVIIENNYKGNVTNFARAIGMNQVTVLNYVNRNRKLSFEFICNIISQLNVSAEWLFRGTGTMYLNDEEKPSGKSFLERVLDKIPTCGDEAFYEREINRLLDENMKLRKEQSRLTAIVESINNNSQA